MIPHWVPRHQHPLRCAAGHPHKCGRVTGHSGYPHKTFVKELDTPVIRTGACMQLDTPAPLYLRRISSNIRTSCLCNWTLLGPLQPNLQLTLVISTRVPKHLPLCNITSTGLLVVRTSYLKQLDTQATRTGFASRVWALLLSAQKFPSNWNTPVFHAETMVPGHWAFDGSIRTSVS